MRQHLTNLTCTRQPVAAHHQPQAEAAFPGPRVGPLVDERVIDAPAGTLLPGRLHRFVAVERDVPGGAGPALGDGAGRVRVQRGARLVLGQPLAEAVGRAVGTEAHLGLAHLATAKVPHDPLVGMERSVGQQPGERVGAAPLELDEAADAVVDPEARRLPVAGRPPVELFGEPARLGQGRGPIHLQVELDDGKGAREVGPRERGARDGECGERRPEDRFPEHGSNLLRRARSVGPSQNLTSHVPNFVTAHHARELFHNLRMNPSSTSTSSGSVPLCSRMLRMIFRGIPIPMCSRYP